MKEMIDLVFMLSNWYSGATILAILLNNNSRLICNGESFPFQYDGNNKEIYVCSCGKHIRECDFYTTAAQSLTTGVSGWSNDFRVLPHLESSTFINKIACSFSSQVWLRNLLLSSILPFRAQLNSYIQAHLQFYEKARQYKNACCYIDGTKSVRRAELFVQYGKLPVRVIYLIRDGRGFCWSYLKNRKLSISNLKEAAAAWLEYISLVDIFSERYNFIHVKTVRYEDLCSSLSGTLREVCDFMCVDFEQTMIGKPMENHVLGNRIRSNFDGIVLEDLSWKQNFSPEVIAELEDLLRPSLERYGYL